MHEFVSKDEAVMTRNVVLRNLDTGTEDICFDDSDLDGVSFDFMEIGKTYDCLIDLLGTTTPQGGGKKILCRVVDKDVTIGNAHRVKVRVGKDIYYIPRTAVENQLESGSFFFYYTRKDLAMVDGVVNFRYLLPMLSGCTNRPAALLPLSDGDTLSH
jgi:hypothetical protein